MTDLPRGFRVHVANIHRPTPMATTVKTTKNQRLPAPMPKTAPGFRKRLKSRTCGMMVLVVWSGTSIQSWLFAAITSSRWMRTGEDASVRNAHALVARSTATESSMEMMRVAL